MFIYFEPIFNLWWKFNIHNTLTNLIVNLTFIMSYNIEANIKNC